MQLRITPCTCLVADLLQTLTATGAACTTSGPVFAMTGFHKLKRMQPPAGEGSKQQGQAWQGYLAGLGGREEHGLAVLGQQGDDLAHLLLKAHL